MVRIKTSSIVQSPSCSQSRVHRSVANPIDAARRLLDHVVSVASLHRSTCIRFLQWRYSLVEAHTRIQSSSASLHSTTGESTTVAFVALLTIVCIGWFRERSQVFLRWPVSHRRHRSRTSTRPMVDGEGRQERPSHLQTRQEGRVEMSRSPVSSLLLLLLFSFFISVILCD